MQGGGVPATFMGTAAAGPDLGGLGELVEAAALVDDGQGQAVATANAGLFKNVFEMNLHRTGADSQLAGDVLVFHSLFDEFEDLLFAGG